MTDAPDRIAYLDAAAGTPVGLDYKRRFVELLDVRSGHTVVDIGCGPGTDLGRLVDAVGGGGSVVGVDRDPDMLAEAGRRFAGQSVVRLMSGDAHTLPLEGSTVDRARTDRVLQHVADPAAVLADVRRVLRPGGILGMAEPDWDTLAVADEDVATSRRFVRYLAGRVRNATLGRRLAGLAVRAGFDVRSLDAVPMVFRDFATAETILGLRRNAARAVRAGAVTAADVGPWLCRLEDAPFVAAFTFYLVTVTPAGGDR